MIGIYDYTVLLTYISLLSASTGIVVSLSGTGHPYIGMFFLLLCGLCDAFDGKVARTKKNRTEMERNFGIQIDSLSDLVAFGVLPACIGTALLWNSRFLNEVVFGAEHKLLAMSVKYLLFAILILYVLAAMIRLAYYNVTEEERQKTEGGSRRYFVGVPVTSASVVFPLVLLLEYITARDISLIYFVITLLLGLAFVSKVRVPKPGLRGIIIMIIIGAIEFAALLIFRFIIKA